jgi:hypothetical protein
VCFHLLSALGEGFDVLGSHQTVSSSSLPLSTPPEVIDMMINHFSEQLKDDALALLPLSTAPLETTSKKQKQTKRRDSVESQTMSISEGVQGDVTVMLAKKTWGEMGH